MLMSTPYKPTLHWERCGGLAVDKCLYFDKVHVREICIYVSDIMYQYAISHKQLASMAEKSLKAQFERPASKRTGVRSVTLYRCTGCLHDALGR